jgi:hypothetical protein
MPAASYLTASNVRAWGMPDGGAILVSWTNPVHPFWNKTVVCRSTIGFVEYPADPIASIIYADTGTSFLDTGLAELVDYYYSVFGYNDAQYSIYNPAYQMYTNNALHLTNNVNWLTFGPTKLDNLWGFSNENTQATALSTKRYGIGALMYGD